MQQIFKTSVTLKTKEKKHKKKFHQKSVKTMQSINQKNILWFCGNVPSLHRFVRFIACTIIRLEIVFILSIIRDHFFTAHAE